MSYLMMHTTRPLIQNRQIDYAAHEFVRADSFRRREAFTCHPSDSMPEMAGSFDMDVKPTPNSVHNSEYDTGHVPNAAQLLVRGVVMTMKKAQWTFHWAFLYEIWRRMADKLGLWQMISDSSRVNR